MSKKTSSIASVFVILLILGFVLIPLQSMYVYASTGKSSYNIPPLRQIKSGVMLNNIVCKTGFVLMFKVSNNMPHCVKPTTASILVPRGIITVKPSPQLVPPSNGVPGSMSNTTIVGSLIDVAKKGNTITLPNTEGNPLKLESITVTTDKQSYLFSSIFEFPPDVAITGDTITISGTTINIQNALFLTILNPNGYLLSTYFIRNVPLSSDGSFSFQIPPDSDPLLSRGDIGDDDPRVCGDYTVLVSNYPYPFWPIPPAKDLIIASTHFNLNFQSTDRHHPGACGNPIPPPPPPPPPRPDSVSGTCGTTNLQLWHAYQIYYEGWLPPGLDSSQWTQGSLNCVSNPNQFVVPFVKYGSDSSSCSDPNQVINLQPGYKLTPDGMRKIFGSTNPYPWASWDVSTGADVAHWHLIHFITCVNGDNNLLPLTLNISDDLSICVKEPPYGAIVCSRID